MDQEEFFEIAEEDLKREAEKRRFIYSDVEEIIQQDFLLHEMELEGNNLVLRSALPDDYRVLGCLRFVSEREFICWTISHNIYMLNGFVVSPEKKDNHAFQIYHDFISKLPWSYIEVLYSQIVGLRYRVERCLKLVEAFAYEGYSRNYWQMIKESKNWKNTNIVGRVWKVLNESEDALREEDTHWEQTKVIAGSMSGKAFDQIGKFLKEAKSKQKQIKQRVIEDAVNWVFYGDPEEQKKKEKPLKVVFEGKQYDLPVTKGSATVEDMLDEMKKVMSGEKDFHDMLVEDYHENIRRKREEIRQQRRQALEEAIARRSEEEVTGGTIIAGYTREQLEQLNMSREKKTGQIHDEKETFLYDRYFKPSVVPGVLGKTGPERATQENTSKNLPEKRSLQEQIANRNPHFKKE